MPASPNGPLSELAPRFSLSAGLMGEAAGRPEATRQTQALWFLSGQTSEGEAVRHVPIYSFPFRVGRRTDVSLSLAYRTVSSVHAELFERDSTLVLRDLGSTNGTFVNGVRVIDEHPLAQNREGHRPAIS